MLDDLRDSAGEVDFDEFEEEGDSFEDFDFEGQVLEEDGGSATEKRFLGMTAVERMFIAVFLFLNVTVIGLALLIATGRILL